MEPSPNERGRKRSYKEDSEDSFDAPVEFETILPAAKMTKISPLKPSLLANSPIKRSPKITLPTEEFIVSDWDDSPENSLLEQPKTSIKNEAAPPSALCSQESDAVPESPRKLREETIKNVKPATEYYLDRLLRQKAASPQGQDSDFCHDQIPLKVLKIVKSEEETYYLLCRRLDGAEAIVYIQGIWEETLVDVGMEIRLIDAEHWGDKDFLLKSEKGFLIVEPDLLLTSTAISGTSWCPRKIVLNHRFKGGEGANKSMLVGCIMHELFQISVKHPDPSNVTKEWLLTQWRENISSHVMEAFVALNFSPKAFETELFPYAEIIVSWVQSHLRPTRPTNMPTGSSISAVHDIEENIWDPILGLKGKIDTTLKVHKSGKLLMEPLELKTGKSGQSVEHSCQVLLYNMMLSTRYDQSISSGSLLYLKDGTERAVIPKSAEIAGIIHQRNSLAYYILQKDHKILPEPRADPMFCGKCEQALTCSLYQVRTSQKASLQFEEFARAYTAHLTEEERTYFGRWTDGLYNEYVAERTSSGKPSQSDLWKVDPDDREPMGQCLASMRLTSIDDLPEGPVKLTFTRKLPFDEKILQAGSICTVSQGDKFAIAICSVLETKDDHITLRCERAFQFLKADGMYELDVYSSFSSFANAMGSLLLLMGNDENSTRLRSLIVNLAEPRFLSTAEMKLSRKVLSRLASSGLNSGQRSAIELAIRAQEYSLIEGLPGAGKTTTIAVLIQCLVDMGQSVLLTSYTNSAVDTVLLKVLGTTAKSQVLRLGRKSEHAQIADCSMQSRLETLKNDDSNQLYQNTRRILRETPIVACTCYHSSREVLLSWRRFDVCIVDEASMVMEPHVLPTLAASNKFIMVGDTKQLAPLVLHKESRNFGLHISLFERLQTHRMAVSSLTEQFRMNRELARISSQLFYENRLVCANKTVADATINSSETKEPITSSKVEHSLVWVDVPPEPFEETHTTNRRELEAVLDIVDRLKQIGIEASDIGIMCTYNAQVELFRAGSDIQVNTVDQYQGRDKKIIIWSPVWTCQSRNRCELLHDERRVNVALTRAKQKLIVVGCAGSMKEIPIMSRVVSLFKNVTIPHPILTSTHNLL